MKKIVLSDFLPDFACELEHLLLKENKPELACQVENMRVDVARCVGGEDFCTMLCTGLRPPRGWGAGQTTIVLAPDKGNIFLDVIDGDIVAIEVFFRKDVQEKLLQLQNISASPLDGSESVPYGSASIAR
jgi:hypothetical protein